MKLKRQKWKKDMIWKAHEIFKLTTTFFFYIVDKKLPSLLNNHLLDSSGVIGMHYQVFFTTTLEGQILFLQI